MENINSAYRLHKILQESLRYQNNKSTLEVWAGVFEIEETNPNKKVSRVSSALSLLHSEVELIKARMENADFSISLYEPYLKEIERAINGASLTNPWQEYKRFLTNEVLLSLRFCSEIIPNEEHLISEKERKTINDEIDSLELSIDKSDLPDPLKRLLFSQILLIRKALRDYGIVGVKAMKDAVHKAAGELTEYKEIIIENKDSEEVSKLRKILDKFTKFGDGVIKTEKTLSSSGKLIETFKSIFENTIS